MAVAVFFTVIAAIGVLRSVKIVPADSAYVVERFGRYFRTMQPGVNVVLPFLDRIAHRFSSKPREAELTETGITYDNVPYRATVTFTWQIADARKAAYSSAAVADFVAQLVRSRLREEIGRRSSRDLRETTRETASALLRNLDAPAAEAGAKIVSLSLKDVERAA